MDCTVFILAGGRSSRFGEDKANAVWRGRILIALLAGRLRGYASEIIAVARREQDYSAWPVDRVVFDDPALPEGPLRGLVAGLAACSTPHAIILSCDAPFVQLPLLDALQRRIQPGVLAVLPEWEGRLQPLVSLFHISATPVLQAELIRGEQSPKKVLNKLPHLILSVEECLRADPRGLSFLNINTLSDFALLEQLKANSRFN